METDHFHYIPAITSVLAISSGFFIASGIALLLLVVAALLAGAEVAVLALSTSSIEKLEDQDDRHSEIIREYVKDPERLHLTISIATIFIIVINFLLFISWFEHDFGFSWFWIIVAAILYIFIILIFTELIPRFFSRIADSYIHAVAYPVKITEIVLSPLSGLIERITGNQGKRVSTRHHISIEDISSALELTSDSVANEEEILKGLVNFGNIDVQKILKPRIDVIAVDKDIDAENLYEVIVDSGYSRIPVFYESFDNVVGILYVKDILPHLKDLKTFDWTVLIRPPYFVPETKKVKELLKELQTQKIQMAVVVDEYGGTTGIVTLEDILEEIVGEIADESDEEEEIYTQIDENTFIFDGITLLNDFCRITQCDEIIFEEVRGDADTLAGLILELKGEIPENGDELDFPPYKFIVEQVDNRRIKQVRVVINRIEEPEEEKS